MTGPLAVALAAVMATTALYCAGRLVVAPLRRRASQPGVDLLHLLMGAVMAATLLGLLSRRWDVVWVLTFAATAFWYVREGLVNGNRHSLQHGVGSVAMLAMVVTGSSSYAGGVARSLPTAAGMGGMPGMGGTTHAGALAPAGLLLAALAVGVLALTAADTVQLSRGALVRAGGGSASQAASGSTRQGRPLAPRCAAGCRVTMGVAMAVALFAML
jgi:Domain of unknown function (DUF5134)